MECSSAVLGLFLLLLLCQSSLRLSGLCWQVLVHSLMAAPMRTRQLFIGITKAANFSSLASH